MMNPTSDKVKQVIAEALCVDVEDVRSEAGLMDDLGAESLDFLDIVFRLEKEFGVKLPRGEIGQKARGGLTAEEFEVDGVIQPKGLERLRVIMPDVNPAKIKEGLRVRDIPGLFTVATFERMVHDQLAEGENAPEADEGLASMGVNPGSFGMNGIVGRKESHELNL